MIFFYFWGILYNENGTTSCPETSLRNYHYAVRNNNLEERSSRLLRGESLKSRDLNLHLRFMSRLHVDPFYSGWRDIRDVYGFGPFQNSDCQL